MTKSKVRRSTMARTTQHAATQQPTRRSERISAAKRAISEVLEADIEEVAGEVGPP